MPNSTINDLAEAPATIVAAREALRAVSAAELAPFVARLERLESERARVERPVAGQAVGAAER
jgi:hypothetical protein